MGLAARCLICVLAFSSSGSAQSRTSRMSSALSASLPASRAGGQIARQFVDPFITSETLDRVYEFLKQPSVFEWHDESTIRDIQRDLAQHFPVELDLVALEEMGLSDDFMPGLGGRSKKASASNSLPKSASNPFGNNVDPFGGGSTTKENAAVTNPPAMPGRPVAAESTTMSSTKKTWNKWWETASAASKREEKATNGAVLFHYLSAVDLTLHLHRGRLTVTTRDRADQQPCMRIYDVTPLVKIADGPTLNAAWMRHPRGSLHDTQSLIDLIQISVAPEGWESMGGGATITSYSTSNRCWLVVGLPLPTHWQLGVLLDRLNQ